MLVIIQTFFFTIHLLWILYYFMMRRINNPGLDIYTVENVSFGSLSRRAY